MNFEAYEYEINVIGIPRPQGSKRPYRTQGGIVLVESCKGLPEWRQMVSAAALMTIPAPDLTGPVGVQMLFRFPRPKGTLTSKGEIRPDQDHMRVRPDLDKLVRAVLDSLTGIAYRDDAQVVTVTAYKEWTEGPPGVTVRVDGRCPKIA